MTRRARLLLLFHTPGICCFLFAFALSNSLQMKKDKGPVKHDADNSFSLTKEYQEKKEEVKQITTTATKNERHNNATVFLLRPHPFFSICSPPFGSSLTNQHLFSLIVRLCRSFKIYTYPDWRLDRIQWQKQ